MRKLHFFIALGLIVAVGGVFAWQKGLLESKEDKISNQTTDWKTYSDEKVAHFERNKTSFQIQHKVVGEDATSGFYYTIYRDGGITQVVRELWNGGAQNMPTITYYFFEHREVVLIRTFIGDRKDLNDFIADVDKNLKPQDEFSFRNLQMTQWMKTDGTLVSSEDPRWNKMEQALLTNARYVSEL